MAPAWLLTEKQGCQLRLAHLHFTNARSRGGTRGRPCVCIKTSLFWCPCRRPFGFAPQRVVIGSPYTGIHDQRERSQVQCLHVCLKPHQLDLLWSYERNATRLLATKSPGNQGSAILAYIVLIWTAVFRSFLDGSVSHEKAKQHLTETTLMAIFLMCDVKFVRCHYASEFWHKALKYQWAVWISGSLQMTPPPLSLTLVSQPPALASFLISFRSHPSLHC